MILIDKPLDKFSDLYPICSKLKHDLNLLEDGTIIDMQFDFNERLNNYIPQQNCNFNFTIKQMLNIVKSVNNNYTKDNCDVNLLLWCDALYYYENMDKFSLLNDETPLKIKEITNDQDYFKKVVQFEKEIREQPLTDEENELLANLEKELNDRGFNIIKQGHIL
jgi:hypothetical protein